MMWTIFSKYTLLGGNFLYSLELGSCKFNLCIDWKLLDLGNLVYGFDFNLIFNYRQRFRIIPIKFLDENG